MLSKVGDALSIARTIAHHNEDGAAHLLSMEGGHAMAIGVGLAHRKKKHLTKLREGVDSWNQWRRENPQENPFLSGETLGNIDLRGANLSDALLKWADLNHADLSDANLQNADLHATSLLDVLMPDANLRNANLSAVVVNGDLRRVDLTHARLHGTNIYGCLLEHADFHEASCGSTVFAGLDLSTCIGLGTIEHRGPSTVGVDTIYYSKGKISEDFLRGAEVPDPFIASIPSLMEAFGPLEYYKCFISYSHENKNFAGWLRKKLQVQGVSCWFDDTHLEPGQDLRAGLKKAIQEADKFLLCCSENSLNSAWVQEEIETALQSEQRLTKERGMQVQSIIALDLDGFLFRGEWKSGFREQIRSRVAADFEGWSEGNENCEDELAKLLRALKADEAARRKRISPKPK
jgi:TIR domain/Pentapeptide repeats (8 copies)